MPVVTSLQAMRGDSFKISPVTHTTAESVFFFFFFFIFFFFPETIKGVSKPCRRRGLPYSLNSDRNILFGISGRTLSSHVPADVAKTQTRPANNR